MVPYFQGPAIHGICKMIVQWYPGHMNKARKMMEEDIKLVDMVIEVLDARAPIASRNPDIKKLSRGKPDLILLNKADLADERASKEWKKYFEDEKTRVVFLNSKNKEGLREVLPAVKELTREKTERDLKRGIKNQPVRAMVVGIPNVGKSTFINAFAGKNIAKTGNKPGVTKGKQWIKLSKDLELLDTPGILWPKFEDQEIGKKLAYLGSINDEILVTEELAGALLLYLFENYADLLKERFDITAEDVLTESEEQFSTKESRMLDRIAIKRGILKPGGVPDYFKTSGMVLDEFRNGKIGKITLERPNE